MRDNDLTIRALDRIDEGERDASLERKSRRGRRVKVTRMRSVKGQPNGKRGSCAAEGCTADTWERKPYCADHLDNLPEVARVKAILATDPVQPVYFDILMLLDRFGGHLEFMQLKRDVGAPHEHVVAALERLEREGRVSVTETLSGARKNATKVISLLG